ncbi:MAG: hypothetical protein KA214_01290 [Neisseriaceae bacterium]|nr:hypothetical protein [Neisseriaceae bacterium]
MAIKKIKPWLPLALAVALLSGCIPYDRHRPAYADLCQKQAQRYTVVSEGKTHEFTLYGYLYNPKMFWSDDVYKQSQFSIKPRLANGWLASREFYVSLVLVANNQPQGATPLPVYYDARQATVTVNDGRRIGAYPQLFLSTNTDTPVASLDYSRPSPVNLNDPELNSLRHKKIHTVQIHKGHGAVAVVFPVSELGVRFDAEAKWQIYLGDLTIMGQAYPIHELSTCHVPAKRWIGIEPLMR